MVHPWIWPLHVNQSEQIHPLLGRGDNRRARVHPGLYKIAPDQKGKLAHLIRFLVESKHCLVGII